MTKPVDVEIWLEDRWLAEKGVGYPNVSVEEEKKQMSAMTEFEKAYQAKVFALACERNLIAGSDNMRQLLKTATEAREMVNAARKGNVEEYIDGIGDQWVTVVIGMLQSDVLYQDALDSAYAGTRPYPPTTDDIVLAVGLISEGILKQDKKMLTEGYGEYLAVLRVLPDFEDGVSKAWEAIKDRKGKMVNGVFVKEQDLEGITNE